MAYRVVRFRVQEYDRFKRVRAEVLARFPDVGIRSQQYFRHPDDPNEMIQVTEADDLERVRRLWWDTEEYKAIIRRGGITEATGFIVLDELGF